MTSVFRRLRTAFRAFLSSLFPSPPASPLLPPLVVPTASSQAFVAGGPPPFQVGKDMQMSSVPESGASRTSSFVDIGRGLRVEFRSSAAAINNQSGTHVVGAVVIVLLGEDFEHLVSDVSTSSPNSPATAVDWVASMIEAKLSSLKIEFVPLDMAVLEAASRKAYRDSLVHCVSAFATFFVQRVDREDAYNAWKSAEIRFIMDG